MLRHKVRERRGDDGLAGDRFLGHGALLDRAGADVVEEQDAHLVAGDELIGAVRALHGDADAVGVGVRGEEQVRADFLREVDAHFHGGVDLGVRVRAGGEVAVRVLLLRNDGDVGDADVLQNGGDRDEAGAVQRGVDEFQAGVFRKTRADLMGLDRVEEGSLAAVADELDEALGNACREGDVLRAGEDVGLLDAVIDDGDRVIGHLTAVGTVRFVAVVLGGVVGRGDHDARVAVVVAGGEAQRRDRVQGVVDADFDAVGGEDAGSSFREVPALETGVIGDGDRLRAALGLDPVGDALGGLADDPDVHAVGAGAQRAAKARGTELERDGEAVRNGVFIALDLQQFGLEVEVLELGFQPAFIFIHVH